MAKVGRPHGTKYIETPAKMWELFCNYISDCDDTPYIEQNWVGKNGDEVYRKIIKHISFEGFEGWLCEQEIVSDLGDYSCNKDGRYSDYATIITRIRKICKGRLLTAAMSNMANGNVVSRYLGLKESTESEVTVKEYNLTLDLG